MHGTVYKSAEFTIVGGAVYPSIRSISDGGVAVTSPNASRFFRTRPGARHAFFRNGVRTPTSRNDRSHGIEVDS